MRKGTGAPEEILTKLFGSVSRARILCFLHTFPGESFYQRQIMFETGLSLRPVQRELNNLLKLGVLKKQKTQNRMYYGINPDSCFFNPLKAICISVREKDLQSSRKPPWLHFEVNPSALRPKGRSGLRVNPEPAIDSALENRAWRSRRVNLLQHSLDKAYGVRHWIFGF